MTAKDLKNALLQEAVQGKLVPQIASEGNARDLLEKIRKERMSHGLDFANAKSGKKSKKETALAGSNPCDIPGDEIPFDIPESWCWCRLGDLTEIVTKGSSPSWQGINYVDNGILFVTSENVGDEELLLSKKKYLEPKFNDIQSRSILKKGDLLTNIVGASIGRTAIFDLEINNANINQAVALIRLKNIELNSYLVKVLNSKVIFDQMSDNTVNTARANISLTTVENFKVPLPPLAEQKRIVAAIEKFMPLIEEYGKKETALNQLNAQIGTLTKKAILQEAVQGKLLPQIPSEGNAKDLLEQIKAQKAALIKEGKIKKDKPLPEITEDEIPFDIPENWCWCRLGELSTLVTKGTTPRGGNVAYLDCGVGFLRAENVAGTKDLDLSNLKFIDEDTHNNFLKRSVLEENDLLITIAGTLGRTAIVKKEDLPLNANQAISIVRLVSPDLVCLEYLIFAINAPELQRKLIGQTKVTAIPNLTLEIIENCEIPLPPLSEQKCIVAAIEQLLPLCEKLGK